MVRYETGMLAKAMAGHDTGKIYMIIQADERHVYLADGKLRPLTKLKKKNRRHIQVIHVKYNQEPVTDTYVKRKIAEYQEEEAIEKEEQ